MKLETNKGGSFRVRVTRIADTDGPEPSLPYKMYHYCNFDTAFEKILPFKQLLLSPLETTNDPRENRTFRFASISPPNQKDFIANNWPGRVSKILRSDCKLICFSTDYKEHFGYEYSRMWAYYGGGHKGICLEIDTKKFLQENRDIIDIGKFRMVEYLKLNLSKPPTHKTVDFGRVDEIGLDKYLRDEFRIDHLKYLYFTKDYEWESERECRLLHFSNNLEHEYCSINDSLTGIYTGVDFHKSYIPSLKELSPGTNLYGMYYPEFRLVATPL